jgi:hypothetical protein
LIRDLLVFQVKLGADAFRDLLLSPASIAIAIYDLVTGGDKPGRNFYALLALGRRSDRFIELFGDPETPDASASEDPTLDTLVGKVESMVVREYERGGATTTAKDAISRERRRSDDPD